MANQPATNQQQQTRVITPYEQLKGLVKRDEYIQRFAQALGEQRARQFLASVLNVVATSDNLIDAEPNSILTAAMTAALFDLPIDKNLGFAWIVAYKNKDERGATRKLAQFQMGYKGYVQLAIRSGAYVIINAIEVYEGEEVIEDRMTGRVFVQGKPTSGTVKGYAGYFELKNGLKKWIYWSAEKMQEHARRYSKTYGRPTSVWTTHPHEMGKKTILKMMLSKWGILSVTMQNAMEQDMADDVDDVRDLFSRPMPTMPVTDPEIIDGDVIYPEDKPFDPVALLVENGISENEHAARGLLKSHVPEAVAQDAEKLLIWGNAYRSQRNEKASPEDAATYASTIIELSGQEG